jgi:membrane-associated protein
MKLVNLKEIILQIGLLGVFGIIFAESGLFFGFFLPGDSLLLTAGLLASQGFFDIKILILGCCLGAIAGDSVGYWFGNKTGPRIFKRPNSLLFKKENLLKAKAFYEKHGGKTIILARFMPFIRTFAPIVAGAGEMHYYRFLFFNVLGGISWVLAMSLLGYFLGTSVPDIDKYILFIIGGIIFLSVLPTAVHLWRDQREEIFVKVKTLLLNFKSRQNLL